MPLEVFRLPCRRATIRSRLASKWSRRSCSNASFGMTTSWVLNTCSFPQTLLLVCPNVGDSLVSLTVVHAPHTGHFILLTNLNRRKAMQQMQWSNKLFVYHSSIPLALMGFACFTPNMMLGFFMVGKYPTALRAPVRIRHHHSQVMVLTV